MRHLDFASYLFQLYSCHLFPAFGCACHCYTRWPFNNGRTSVIKFRNCWGWQCFLVNPCRAWFLARIYIYMYMYTYIYLVINAVHPLGSLSFTPLSWPPLTTFFLSFSFALCLSSHDLFWSTVHVQYNIYSICFRIFQMPLTVCFKYSHIFELTPSYFK